MHITYKNPRVVSFSLYSDLMNMGLFYPRIPSFILREFPSYDVAQGLIGKPER